MKNAFSMKTILTLACAGGALEMYDFVIYIFFADILAKLFFPMTSTYIGMMSTFAIFASGYLFRPIGGIIFGHFGDRFGRRQSLLITITLMAGSMLAMALMPTYSQVGITAPIFFCLFRIIQGIALGGDLPGAITFVNEYAANNRRGLITGLLFLGINFGLLLAAFVSTLCVNVLTHAQFMQWGWRVAFAFGMTLFFVGIYFRLKNIETPLFMQLYHEHKQHRKPILMLFRLHRHNLLRGMMMMTLHAVIIVQLFLYMPIYLSTIAKIDSHEATLLNAINIFIFSCCIPFFGHWSDVYGRKRFFIIGSILFLILSYPLYALLNSGGEAMMVLALLCFAFLSAIIVGIVPETLTELFPTNVRNSAMGLSYNIGFALFGGVSPIISEFLVHRFHQPSLPSVNLMVIAFVLLCVVIPMPFSKNKPLL